MMWSLTSSTPDGGRGSEAEHEGGKQGEKVLDKFSLPQTGLDDPHCRVTLIRARPASSIPPAHFQLVSPLSKINLPFNGLISHSDVDSSLLQIGS